MNKKKILPRKLIVSKGYTLSVTSWENDGDNYKTNSITVESKELAMAIARLCKTVFASSSNGEGGIGNLMEDDEEEANEVILPYMQSHPELYLDKKNPSEENLINICMNYNQKLMGGSEYYFSRVFESCSLTYSPEDVFLEEIEIEEIDINETL